MTDRLDNGRYHKFALNPTIPVLEFGVGARTRLAELSSWQTATRDDAEVARPLHATRAMDQVSPLNVADHAHAYAVVEQARQNVEGYATLRSLALDRGFLDGKLLSKLDGDGIVIDIPAKSNMTITTDAREMARRAERLAAQGRDLPGCTYTERIEQVRRGSGKNATVDERKTVVRVHAYFVFTCMALVTAFRLHQAHAEEAERRGEDTGIGRFRRQLEMKNRDQVVVFCGEHFGVFRNFECAVLLGATVRDRAVMGETVRAVRNRCGVPTADSSRSASARVPADAVLRPGVSRRRARRDTSAHRGGSEPDPMGDLTTSLRDARVAQTRRRAEGDELPRRAPSHAGGRARAPATARMHARQRAARPAASACRERGGTHGSGMSTSPASTIASSRSSASAPPRGKPRRATQGQGKVQ